MTEKACDIISQNIYLVDVRVQRVVVVKLVALVLKLLIQDRVYGTHHLPLELEVLYDKTVTCIVHKKLNFRRSAAERGKYRSCAVDTFGQISWISWYLILP